MNDKEHTDFVNYIQSYFKEAYRFAEPYIERKEIIQRAFDGKIDPDTWATLSEINIPLLRTAVLQVVPFVMNYLFPTSKFIELIPDDENVTFDQISRVEEVLENTLMHKMSLKERSIPIVQDAIKFGSGYGEVRRITTTQPERELVRFFGEEGLSGEQARLTRGAPTEEVELRWIPYETVIPTPDGDTMEDCTCVFQVDTIREDQFRAMFERDRAYPEEDQLLMGDPDQIIEDTRSGKLDGGYFPLWWIMTSFTGDNNAMQRLDQFETMRKLTVEYENRTAPVIIPVLKAYFKNEHVWLANGQTLIYHVEDGLETMARPIIKADSAVDGGNWYAQSDVSASKDVQDGIITFKNALMDLLTQHLHPVTVYNETAMAQVGKAPDTEPYSKVSVLGRFNEAIGYLQPPPLNPALFNVGQILEQDNATANGQPLQLQGQGTAGIMRGGSGAFESLMQNALIREEFLGVIMETGFLKPVIQKSLLQLQMMSNPNFSFVKRKDQEIKRLSVTQSEMRHAYDVSINLNAKLRMGINSESMAIARYLQVYKDNPLIDQESALETVNPDIEQHRRLLATPKQVEENIKRIQQMQNTGSQQPMGGTQGEQAVMGGASQRAGANG